MNILQRLREIYAAADFANSFLEAAIHRVGIQLIQGFQARASNYTEAMSQANLQLLAPEPLAPKIPNVTYFKSKDAEVMNQATEGVPTALPSIPLPGSGESNSTSKLSPSYKQIFHLPYLDSEMNCSELMDLAEDTKGKDNDLYRPINFEDSRAEYFTANLNQSQTIHGDEAVELATDSLKTVPRMVRLERDKKGLDLFSLGKNLRLSDRSDSDRFKQIMTNV